ncbi:MAG: MBL fold metallo-hydrolase [Crenarchaeota archaeon]|nr:MBL fold metallo-hydrolase [Thermoproteota archaeon]
MEIELLGTESLGVRGLSCYIDTGSHRILIDPGVALGYTRWKLHPHPLQALMGDIIRAKITMYWKKADYIVLTHMHGDHVPLYNANPFQLDLYMLDHHGDKKIIAPHPSILNKKERIRLAKIHELYGERLITIKWRAGEIGPVRFFGPYNHGLSYTGVYIVYISGSPSILHLSDTGLLAEKVVEIAREYRPDIVITDGPPLYRYLHDEKTAREILNKAEQVLNRIARYADKIIVDHHINRCDQGYRWIRSMRNNAIMTAAEYMGKKPLLLESWRRTLYQLLPVSNYWFTNDYRGTIVKYKDILYRLIGRINDSALDINESLFYSLLSRALTEK